MQKMSLSNYPIGWKKNEWVRIGYGGYEVNRDGLVRSVDHMVQSGGGRNRLSEGRTLKSFITNSGYKCVSLTHQHKKFYIHRLLASAYFRKMKKGEEVNHKDGNKLNNSLDNLEIVSSSDNKKHAYAVLGKRPWNIKLNKKIADEIRFVYDRERLSQSKLGDIYGVSTMVINRIINNVQKEYKI
jgi:hypothetical protein